jgi:hypothetical protein
MSEIAACETFPELSGMSLSGQLSPYRRKMCGGFTQAFNGRFVAITGS